MEANDLPQNSQTLTELQLLFSFRGGVISKDIFKLVVPYSKKLTKSLSLNLLLYVEKIRDSDLVWSFLRMGTIESTFWDYPTFIWMWGLFKPMIWACSEESSGISSNSIAAVVAADDTGSVSRVFSCIFKCFFMLDLTENCFPQKEHMWGLAPLWTRKCTVRWDFWVKDFWQTEQV